MTKKAFSRKDFIKNTALGMAGVVLPAKLLKAKTLTNTSIENVKTSTTNYTLKNVRLETGFVYDGNDVVDTQTALYLLEIKEGKIAAIKANQPNADAIDAKGALLLPSFKDMHIHLDKTFYGEKWHTIKRRGGGVKGMIALEQEILPQLLENATFKAEKLIELLQSKGTGFARSHVNIEPTSKLQSLVKLQKALDNKKNGFGAELVAFPQHGIYYTESVPYMKEAAQTDIDFIGGLDPFSIDGAIEKTMDFTVQLALDNNKGIDIHLHESGQSGIKTINYLIDKVNENPVLKGKTFVSHAFALGRMPKTQQEQMAEKLADAQIGIVSTIPFGSLIMPIPILLNKGVNVMTGNDSIVDHWSTFGTGSVLQKANLAAQLYGYTSVYGLSRMLNLATAGTLPLDAKGQQQWPKAGDSADMILVDAGSSAEAVSRNSSIKSLIYKGNIVF